MKQGYHHWTPPPAPPALSPDSGARFIDQNADQNPGSPLESLISAVHTSELGFDFSSIDIITDRHAIRKLFRFMDGEHSTAEQGHRAAFKFIVEVLGNTELFTLKGEATRDDGVKIRNLRYKNRKGQGYRDAFDEYYTKIPAAARGSTSHHRILRYNFGGLNFLVRYSADAYLEDEVVSEQVSDNIDEKRPRDLISRLKSTSLSAPPPSNTNNFNKRVTVVKGGRVVPQPATLELVTRNSTTPFYLINRMADLWVSQTQKFATCRYWVSWEDEIPKAAFNDIDLIDIKSRLEEWERANNRTLKKLATLLKQIIASARAFNKPCIVSFSGEKGAPVVIEKLDGNKRVPGLSLKMRALFKPRDSSAGDGEFKAEGSIET